MSTPWVEHVARRLKRWRGLGPDWVVAVSGGGDSVGLLRVLQRIGPEFGLRFSVAHLDHGARGEAARADAEFVAELAGALGLPFDFGHWRPTRPGRFEADARRARYAWLTEVARARGASAVVVGHTRDDQAETILHRILRGTGPRGLSGMPARRPLDDSTTLLRPLLNVSRLEVRSYLTAIGQPFRDDASNADRSRTRARIRHDLLPRLAVEYNPSVADALVRLGELAGASQRALRGRLRAFERAATIRGDDDTMILNRQVLIRLPRFLRAEVLRQVWRRFGRPEAGMGAEHWRRLAILVESADARSSFAGGIDAATTADTLVLQRREPSPPSEGPPHREPVSLAIPGAADWEGGRLLTILDADTARDESIDLDSIEPPLKVRAPAPGDRFEPFGMDGRSTPLNDFFRGRRVPREDRDHVPLLCDANGIVWVVGHRIAHRVRVTEATRRTLGLSWSAPESR